MTQEAVTGILFNDARSAVLLVKRRDIPVWVLPGGGIDKAESPEEAICREMLEETGFEVRIKRKIADYLPVNKLTQPTYFFECEVVGGKAEASSETQAVHFFELNALPKYLAPPYKLWIEDALKNSPEVMRKKITGASYALLVKLIILHPVLVARYLLTRLGIHLNG